MTSDADRVDALSAKAEKLARTVTGLARELKAEKTRNRRQRRTLQFAVAGLLLDLLLSVLVGAGFLRQDATTRQLAAIIADQERTRAEALCPLFSIFLGSYDPASRAEGPAREAYEQAYATIRHVHANVLRCTSPIVPGRTVPIVPKPNALGDAFLPVPAPVALTTPDPDRQSAASSPARTRTRSTVRPRATTASRAETKPKPRRPELKAEVDAEVKVGRRKAKVQVKVPPIRLPSLGR